MRTIPAILSLVAFSACTAQNDVALEHRSEISVQARGVALDHEGIEANVGMSNTTCNVSTEFGTIDEDYDYGQGAEFVADSFQLTPVGGVHLVLTPGNVHLTTPDLYPYQATHDVAGVVDGQLYEGGFVALSAVGSDCIVSWHGMAGQTLATAESGLPCSGASLTVDGVSGMAYVASSEGVHSISQSGETVQLSEMGDALIAFDDSSAGLMAAKGPMVSSFDADGSLRWETDIGSDVAALTDMGEATGVALSTSDADGGRFIVLGEADGVMRTSVRTPSAARALDVSGNGEVLAVTLERDVHYFELLGE